MLSVNGVPSNPLDGDSAQLKLAQDSRLYQYQMVDRDVFNNSGFAADVKELEQNRGNELDHPANPDGIEYKDRIPDLETAVIEYGPEANVADHWMSEYDVLWPDTPAPVIAPKSGITSRHGMDPQGTYTPYDADGTNPDTWGRMADDYDFEQWFFDSASVHSFFQQVKGWHTSDLSTFYPTNPDNSTVVTTGTIDVTETPNPDLTIRHFIPWTLTVTQTSGPGTEWTYNETLQFASFEITSTWDFEYTPTGYEIPDPANGYGIEDGYGDPYGGGLFDDALNNGPQPHTDVPGHVHRVLRQYGDYTFKFTASGNGQTTADYSLTDDYDDAYADTYNEDFDPATLPYETETHRYDYLAQVLNRVQDDALSVDVGDADPYGGGTPDTYTESGNLSWNGTFAGDIASTWTINVTGEELSFINLSESSTMDEDLSAEYSMTYTGNGELQDDGLGNDIKVGMRYADGSQSQNFDVIHSGTLNYSDRLDHMTSNDYDRVVAHNEAWDETLSYDSSDTFDRDIQLLASGNQTVTLIGSGSKDIKYWAEGTYTLDWHDHWESGLIVRDSNFLEVRRDHSDPIHHIADEVTAPNDVTARINTTYSENTTSDVDENGNVLSKTGSFVEDGDAWLLRRLDFDGEWDMTGSGSGTDYVIDTQSQQDYWDEELTDYYRFIFNHDTTLNADGTSTTVINEEGEADGDWMISEEGYYDWAAHSDTQDWTVDKSEFYGSAPANVGSQTLEEWLEGQTGNAWTNATWWGQGAATRSDNWVYWYSDQTTVEKSASGSVTSRVGTVRTDIADPDTDDDTIDGGTTYTAAGGSVVHETDSQKGNRDEFVWTTYDYTYDPNGATRITYDNERFVENHDYYRISTANNLATFHAAGNADYAVNEAGVTGADLTDHFTYEDWWYTDGGHERMKGTRDFDRTSTWNYTDDYDTAIDAAGAVDRSGTLRDWGNSTSTTDEDWDHESHWQDGSSFDTTTYVGGGVATGSIDYDYTTAITTTSDPYGGTITTGTITGSQTDSSSENWSETVTRTYQYCEDYGDGPECWGDTETHTNGDSFTSSTTYTDADFFGPRSGHERKFGWLLKLFTFWD